MKHSRRSARHAKSVNIALQGGGSHGAFTWGVLDKLFEDDRIWIEAVSGTSAGAMNAVVAAQGMYEGGAEGARKGLHEFWKAVSDASRNSPIQRTFWAQMMGDWSLDSSPGYRLVNAMRGIASPYDFNPLDVNPLRELVGKLVNFDKVRECLDMGLFISATNVETGRARIFERSELSLDVVMASACLPHVFKAVEIDGQFYWDGGYTGNPPLFPFFHHSPANDIVIVQINPVVRPGEPRSAAEIENRLNEITFNAPLLHELRSIDFVSRLLDSGRLSDEQYRRMHVHVIQDRKRMRPLDASSKMNSEWAFLRHLFEIGRDAAACWLENSFDNIGERSSIDIRQMFQGFAALPDGISPPLPRKGAAQAKPAAKALVKSAAKASAKPAAKAAPKTASKAASKAAAKAAPKPAAKPAATAAAPSAPAVKDASPAANAPATPPAAANTPAVEPTPPATAQAKPKTA